MLASVQRPPNVSDHPKGRWRKHRDDVGEALGGEWKGVDDVAGKKHRQGGGRRDGRGDH